MKLFWKVFFWVYLVFALYSAYYFFAMGSPLGFEVRTINPAILIGFKYVLVLVPILGLYGLAYRKKFLHHIFWKLYVIVYLLSLSENLIQETETAYTISVFAPIQIIALIGLIIYAYRQNSLFKES